MKVFHSFRLDTANHCLWHAQQRVPLTPKAFDVLRYLVEHSGRLVSQDEILGAVWPETYVNPEVVKKYILGIRKVLGDSADKPVFIETFPRRGYQFVAPVGDARPAAADVGTDASRKMVGRDRALAELDTCLKRALRGQRQVVFVTGEAGIGKTTLVDVFQHRAARCENLRIARGQCVEGFGGKEAYYPILEAIGQLVRGAEGSALVQILAKRAPTWLIQFPSLVKAEQREALQREILGATRERMVREICEALETLTVESPVMLILEDLHWVDPSTLDFISALARRREPAKLALVGTYRPVDVVLSQSPLKTLKQDLRIHRLCEEVALERLEEFQITEYLAEEFAGGNLPHGVANLIFRHSGGNALFMVAIVQDMVKQGLIAQDQGIWKLTKPLEEIDPGVPETLQQMLELLVEQLSAPELRILRSASVVGERFSVWVIASTLAIQPDEIEDLCDGLSARQQFIKSAGINELANGCVSAHYEFRHSVYREVLYRLLPEGNRSQLHRLIGKRLKTLSTPGKQEQELASELAMHFEAGREHEQAIHYLMLAAETAAKRFAYRDSIHVAEHALQLMPRIPASIRNELEPDVLEFIGDAYFALGAMADSAKAYEAAACRAAEADLKAAQVSALTCMVRPFGLIDPDQGIAAMDRAEQVSRTLDDPILLARTQMLAAAIRLIYDTWRKEDADLCAAAHQTIVRLGDSGIPPYHRMMYAQILVIECNYREAFDILEAGIPKVDQTTSLTAHFFALSGKTVAFLRLGRLGEALKMVRDGREMATKNGNDPWLFNFRETWLRTQALDFEGARHVCEMILGSSAEYPTGQPKTIAKVAAGFAELNQGQFERAIQYFREVLDPDITPKFFFHWFWRLTAQLGLSKVWLASGNVSEARREADGFLESVLLTSDPHLQALAWEMATRVALSEGDSRSAQECIEKGIAIAETFDVPVAAWQVHAAAWELYQGEGNEERARRHRHLAEMHILRIGNSFEQDEPIRQIFLDAVPVRRILGTVPE